MTQTTLDSRFSKPAQMIQLAESARLAGDHHLASLALDRAVDLYILDGCPLMAEEARTLAGWARHAWMSGQ